MKELKDLTDKLMENDEEEKGETLEITDDFAAYTSREGKGLIMKNTIALWKILLLLVLFYNCIHAQNENKKCLNGKTNKIEICEIIKNIKSNYNYILNNSKSIMHTDDEECLLGLFDSLKTLSFTLNNEQAIKSLDSIAKYSDGYISEYFCDMTREIFYGRFNEFITYLINNPENNLRDFLIDSLSLELAVEKKENRELRKNKMESFINNKLNYGNYSDSQKKYIYKIFEDIKPEKFD